jgi:hypothetical protein
MAQLAKLVAVLIPAAILVLGSDACPICLRGQIGNRGQGFGYIVQGNGVGARQHIGHIRGVYHLIDATRGRYEYPRLRHTALALAEHYKPDEF